MSTYCRLLRREAVLAFLAIDLFLGAVSACTEECPSGYKRDGSVCARTHDGMAQSAEAGSTPADAPATPAAVGNAGGGQGGTQLAQARSSSGGTQAPAGASSGGAQASTGGSAAGTGASVNPSVSPAGSNAGTGGQGTGDVCSGHAGEIVCDGAALHHCSADGKTASQETCMTEGLCLIGKATGGCALCNPGTFRCTGAELDMCSDAGQYVKSQDCATEALCKEDAGRCTEMLCEPNAVSCSSDGSTLKTCNADGSAFANSASCGNAGCNATLKMCNKCVPGMRMCSGNSVTVCSADGQSSNTMQCVATGGECMMSACQNGACTETKKPSGSACSGGKKCDSGGQCVACISAQDCPDPGPCSDRKCSAGVCSPTMKASGASCGTNMQCDDGRCEQKPCGNGTMDPGEQCDPKAPAYVNSGGACVSDCRLSSSVYRTCGTQGDECWRGSLTDGWLCSGVGICTKDCTSGGSSLCSAAGQSTTCINSPVQGQNYGACVAQGPNCPGGSHEITFASNPGISIRFCGSHDLYACNGQVQTTPCP